MGGGLLQLIAVGVQDIYLIGNPQITFFKSVYKKYTNFSIEAIEQVFSGKPDFGQLVKVKIDRKGDLIKDIILDILLPTLPNGYYWTNGIGNVLIKQVDLEIGGQLIDRHYSEWLDIWSQMTISSGKMTAYNEMVGNFNSVSSLESNSSQPFRLHVPLFFWFNRDYGMALPLIALQFHDVSLKIYFRDLNGCIRNNAVATFPSNISISECKCWVDYINLDIDERAKFANSSHEYLIDQVQFSGNNNINGSANSSNTELSFNHPTKELYWVHSTKAFASPNPLTGNQLLNYSFGTSIETFSNATLLLNGVQRFDYRPATYFRLVQNYQFHTRYGSKNIYTYSFALYPERQQPSGTCNFSKFTNINLHLNYNDIDKPGDLILKVYSVNYNILRIMSGMGGLSFTN